MTIALHVQPKIVTKGAAAAQKELQAQDHLGRGEDNDRDAGEKKSAKEKEE